MAARGCVVMRMSRKGVIYGVGGKILFASGTFNVNGNSAYSVSGLAFQPDLVLLNETIGSNSNNTLGDACAWRSAVGSPLGDDYSDCYASESIGKINTTIDAFGVSGFNGKCQYDGYRGTFLWVAFKFAGKAPSSYASGSVVGNNVSMTVSGLAFTPDLVIIRYGNTSGAASSISNALMGEAIQYKKSITIGPAADPRTYFGFYIEAMNSDGFKRRNANVVGMGGTWYWYAMKF